MQAGVALNPLVELSKFGQSPWYDNIRRSLITSGELKALVDNDGLKGVTSNPAIFEKAIAGSSDYDVALRESLAHGDMDVKALYESLAIADIQAAADVLAGVYRDTNKRDGYVSLEVSPYLANDTAGTIEEARRLWKQVDRPNVMIKVPGTPEGTPAIRALIADGININVTLLFSMSAYEKVAEAFIAGLEDFVKQGGDPAGVASVASFFVSRIDTAVDNELTRDRRIPPLTVVGKVAIANAKLTYARYKELVASPRWQALAAKGAQTQRLLWASTSTKNPAFRDVIYVEELIGADTVDTIPAATFDAFRHHGMLRASLEESLHSARGTMRDLDGAGVSLDEITEKLVVDGVKLFADAFDKLLAAVSKKRKELREGGRERQSATLPTAILDDVKLVLEDWRVNGKVRRLWAGDSQLWTGQDEGKWLGWMGIVEAQRELMVIFQGIVKDIAPAEFTDAVVLGMGGSSLCPETLKKTFGVIPGFPELHVLDSTDPDQILALENKIDLKRTLCIVSSKSGTTQEATLFRQYFMDRVTKALAKGANSSSDRWVGGRFIAITDPGTRMQETSEDMLFRFVFFGMPSIGGRYSALSHFGMIPAAIMGIDVARLLDSAEEMVHSCASCVPPEENPGVTLGAILGVCAKSGRDKLTVVASPGLAGLAGWLEQLMATSTGKSGKGIVPVIFEEAGPANVYGNDRLFAYIRLDTAPDAEQDAAITALEETGQPVVRINVPDIYAIGQEFFRWEVATAVAGSLLAIHPFNQPDVEASKVVTKRLTSDYERHGFLPAEKAFFEAGPEEGGLRLFADPENAFSLRGSKTLADHLRAHLNRARAGDYFCISAYLEMNEEHDKLLQAMRRRVRDAGKLATCVDYGPRFLHSTGQLYKGGPNTGLFLQITHDDSQTIMVPGQKYTFGVVKAAQARGDFEVLVERGRRVLRVHLGTNVKTDLEFLRSAFEQAL